MAYTDEYKIKYNGQNTNDELVFIVYPRISTGVNSLPITATISRRDIKDIVRLAMQED